MLLYYFSHEIYIYTLIITFQFLYLFLIWLHSSRRFQQFPAIIRKHILPNCISVIIITTALQIPSAIFTESYLSFIGMGVRAPMPSLGSLANYARDGLQSYPYKLVFPALTICLIVLSMNLLGDGLRDAFDPKLKR